MVWKAPHCVVVSIEIVIELLNWGGFMLASGLRKVPGGNKPRTIIT